MGVQVATALLAVGFSAVLARERALALVRGNLVLRLDAVAEEAERRAAFDFETGRLTLPRLLRLDLATRFPDPTYRLDAVGTVVERLSAAGPARVVVPDEAQAALTAGEIVVRLDDGARGGWAFAPLLAPDGLPAGGLLLRPLDATLAEELRGTREAFVRATLLASVLAAVLALLLGAVFTPRLVTPLRRMTRRVEALGAGDYADRLPEKSRDELGRLAAAINEMAARVEAAMASLRATDRLRRELVANVGHDLRTPLAALRGYLDEADRLAEEGREKEAADALAVARRQGAHVTRLVDDLFELSKLEGAALGEGTALQRGPVPLAELLNDAARAHRRLFEESGITFEVALPPGLPVLDADGARLLRVLDNLLTNARRHTPPGGTVRLEAEADAETARVRVRDTGEGIPAEAIGSVFDRYYRGTSARTREEGDVGAGLGLAIARAVARAHGGDLTATSTPGEGSAFTLELPRRASAPPAVNG